MNKPQKTKTINCTSSVEMLMGDEDALVSFGEIKEAVEIVKKRFFKEGFQILDEDVEIYTCSSGLTIVNIDGIKKENINYEELMKAWESYQNDEDQKLINKLVAKGYTVEKK